MGVIVISDGRVIKYVKAEIAVGMPGGFINFMDLLQSQSGP